METVVVKISDNSISGSYPSSPNQGRFTGVNSWGNPALFMHLPVPDGFDLDAIDFDGIEIIEKQTMKDSTYQQEVDGMWAKIILIVRNCSFVRTLPASLLSAPEVNDWGTYITELWNLPSSIGSKSLLDLDLSSATGQDDLNLSSNDNGGSNISFEVPDPGQVVDQPLSVTVLKNEEISIQLETDGTEAVISTIQEVIDAINAHRVASRIVTASLVSGSDGSEIVDTFISKTNLAGGKGIGDAVWPTPPTTPVIPGVNG